MIKGKWHPKGSGDSYNAVLILKDRAYELRVDAQCETAAKFGSVTSLIISERLGNIKRQITFDDDTQFFTQNNDAIDKALKGHKVLKNGWIHYLEANLRVVIFACVLVVMVTVGFITHGIPWLSGHIANMLPYETNVLITQNAMKYLDEYLLEDSQLNAEKKHEIRRHFHDNIVPLIKGYDPEVKYSLHFRKWTNGQTEVANALALPSGDIILTDAFVNLTKNQNEIDAILLHEVGHVIHRHGLQSLIETTFLTALVMLVVGDVNFIADFGVGAGALFASSSYSREHETQADIFAYDEMLKIGIDPIISSDVLNRMTNTQKTSADDGDSFLDYFSSHPNNDARARIAEAYSACFKQGLTSCTVTQP
jgi:Zn-dependent protease with chaperone function